MMVVFNIVVMAQKQVEILAKYTDVPVWNGLTDEFHPTQLLADLYYYCSNKTIIETIFALSW